jgi:hypothetical protein
MHPPNPLKKKSLGADQPFPSLEREFANSPRHKLIAGAEVTYVSGMRRGSRAIISGSDGKAVRRLCRYRIIHHNAGSDHLALPCGQLLAASTSHGPTKSVIHLDRASRSLGLRGSC